jgi:diguanylate cyclase (GGDEF)-like protein
MFAVRGGRRKLRSQGTAETEVRTGIAWRGWLAAACLLLLGTGAARAAPAGSPPITRFAPDIQVYPQNFDIAQDPAAVIYVASNDGVLIFDGVRWKLLRLPNGDIARSLAGDGHGRIYVGGYDLFGYIERDAGGQEQFHDLTALFRQQLHGEHFADVWNVLVTPQGVFFMALAHLFEYVPDTRAARLWRYPPHYGTIFEYQGEVVAQFRDQGLRRLRNGGWEPLPGSESLRDLVYQFLHLPDGGLLTLARDGRWREYRDGRISDYPMPPGFPPSSFMMMGRELSDGSLALAGQDGVLHLFDPASRRLRSFRIDSSALNGIVQAADGGLLTLSNLAVFHVDWPTSWSVIRSDGTLNGGIHNIVHYDGRWLALTDSGVYEASGADGAPPAFRRLGWTDFEAWDLLPLEAGQALLAESYNIKLIDQGKARNLFDTKVAPFLLRRSRLDPEVIYVGTETGLALLHREGGQWRLKFSAPELETSRVSSLVELGRRELLVGSDRGGVHRVRLADDLSHIEQLQGYGPAEGIAYGRLAAASVTALADGTPLAATAGGIYRWSGGRFERTELDGLEALRQPDEELTLALAPDGDLWAYSYSRIYHRPFGGAWRQEQVGSILRGSVENLSFDGRDTVLFAANGEMLRYDAGAAAAAGPPALLLREVEELDGAKPPLPLPLQPAAPPRFKQGDMALRFRLALPDYRNSGEDRYQAHLDGFDQRFGDWSDARNYTYRLLPPGEYRFMARARDSYGRVSEIAPFRFTVVPPWYETLWGRALELLLLGLAAVVVGLLVARHRTRRLAQEKLQLEDVVQVRTRELEAANRRLDRMAHIDGLTEIPNRRRLNDYLSEVWSRCSVQGRPVSVLVIDVDHFKEYNDGHGHLAGDEVLKKLTQSLTACLRRAEDLVARFGGDEFVAVLPGAELHIAREVAEIMRRKVEDSGLGITISVGYSSRVPQPNESVWALVHDVDGALYEAKRGGRNRVSGFTDAKPQAKVGRGV